MLPRPIVPPPKHLYPPHPWRLIEARYTNEHADRAETIFSLSNGFLGVRGTFEEGRPSLSPGTFINGFHETWPIVHAEGAYGLAETGQTIVNAPDATPLKLYVDDEPLYLPLARLPEYARILDMRDGTLTRELLWSTPSGKHVRVRTCRLVSFEHRHLMAISYEVTVIDHHAPIAIASTVRNRQDAELRTTPGDTSPEDPRLARAFAHRVLNAQTLEREDHRLLLGYRTTNSGMTLGVGIEHLIDTELAHQTEVTLEEDVGQLVLTAEAQPGVPITITKFVAYQKSRTQPTRELVARCSRTLDRAVRDGFGRLLEYQREHLDRFWERADIEVEVPRDPIRFQQAVRWNLFQLCQASWRAEGAGIAAKGLTGQAYEGHYFWDTEVYVLPFLAYTQPRIARNLLRFRHSMLDAARSRARTLSQRGAMFPWRTISGDEASAYYQAGTAQYHINADIAYAIRKYVDVRGDVDFLVEAGAEILVETARMWEDLGFYGADDRFHIHSVTGPDEYTTVVNDNAYTNLVARLNLNYAAAAVRRLMDDRPEDYVALVHSVDLDDSEIEAWERAAAAMYVPYDEARGINPQDDAFLEREIWDLAATPRDRFPLLLHYHPLVIYRHQVIKQADVVLAMFLLGNEFTTEQKRRNFDYYDPLTTGDSSLSASVQGIVAAEVGKEPQALQYFRYALLMDLADIAGNVSDGVHVASTGGVWNALVFGFGGVRDFDGHLSFDPRLPSRWRRLQFQLRFHNRQIRIELTHEGDTFEILEGEPLEIEVRGASYVLEEGEPVVLGAGVPAVEASA